MMNVFTAVAPFALLSIANAGPSINLEYYKDTGCSSTSLSAVSLSTPSSGCSACTNLPDAGVSFHIGSPASEKQIPQGCEVVGYAQKGCKGQINLQIQGPSNAGTCYASDRNSGDVYYTVASVRLLCL